MRSIIKIMLILTALIVGCSERVNDIKILSYILRDRVILTDELIMKKVLFVAFRVNKRPEGLNNMEICGTISCDKMKLAEYSIKALKGKYGNLIFDLPYHIPGGKYNIEVNILSDKGHVYAREKRGQVLYA